MAMQKMYVIEFEKINTKDYGVIGIYESKHGANCMFGKLAKKVGYEYHSITLKEIDTFRKEIDTFRKETVEDKDIQLREDAVNTFLRALRLLSQRH